MSLPSSPVIGHVVANYDTWIKKSTVQGSLLSPSERAFVSRGTQLDILAYAPELKDGHVLVTLNENIPTEDDSAAYNTWYGFVGDEALWTIELYREEDSDEDDRGNVAVVATQASTVTSSSNNSLKNPSITVPIYGEVGLDDNIPGSTWATWREVIQNDMRRLPTKKSEVEAIVKIAKMLQPWRDKYGPLIVTSWLRPPVINRQVGGASRSRHIVGDAVDFYPKNGSIWKMQADMVRNWGTNGGLGKGAKRGFIHADGRRGGIPVVFNY